MKAEKPKDAGEFPLEWASDAIADLLRRLGIKYIALNPGASFRGLHDSIVNYLGNSDPQFLLTLHEEHAVSIAHGYAKVTERPMAAVVHSNVGLMHATMPIFNAWCDRVPVLVLGATGPVDADLRRPWIDWIHTSKDQGSLVRDYTKWDDLPASVPAALESLLRANLLCRTAPCGPVYVCFDMALQEEKLDQETRLPDVSRFMPAPPQHPSEASVIQAAEFLSRARKPLILIGRTSRSQSGWDNRVRLAEALGAEVLTDLKAGAGFPSEHPLQALPPGEFLSPEAVTSIQDSDVILSLDWIDLGGTLKRVWGKDPVRAKVVHCSVDCYNHKTWSADYHGLAPVDLSILSPPETFITDLLSVIEGKPAGGELKNRLGDERPGQSEEPEPADTKSGQEKGPISLRDLASCLKVTLESRESTLIRVPMGWPGDLLDLKGPLDYLGNDGGAGLGSGPGIAVGVALGLEGSGRIPVAVLGDGDFLMGVTALWTAARYRIPFLIIVANNRSYGNSQNHQKTVAKQRGRSPENDWIGTNLDDPVIDLASTGRLQGLMGGGPVEDLSALPEALETAVREVEKGSGYILDVVVKP
jgi:thiamine pyrophosphate-dependent acetolactate synthase large subunit-like protein